MKDFIYLKPTSVREAVSSLSEHGDGAMPLAGGTALLWAMRRGAIQPDCIVDIGDIVELRQKEYDPQRGLKIGASVTVRELELDESVRRYYPMLGIMAGNFAPTQVRSVATIAGNVCNAAPFADFAPPLFALGAQVVISGIDSERIVPIESFFTGPWQTALTGSEILKEIILPPPPSDSNTVYFNHNSRELFEPSTVSIAAWLQFRRGDIIDLRIGMVGSTFHPTRAFEVEEFLIGKPLNKKNIDEAAKIARDVSSPLSDFRASAEYRRALIDVYIRRALTDILDKQNRNL